MFDEMVSYVKICFKKFVDFSGRARRREYWYFFLFGTIVSSALAVLFGHTGSDGTYSEGFLGELFSLVIAVPEISVSIRRLHDIGKDWKSLLFALIPVFGIIYLYILLARDSDPNPNAYGPSPKYGSVSDAQYTDSCENPAKTDEAVPPAFIPEAAAAPSVAESSPSAAEVIPGAPAETSGAPAFCAYCGAALAPGANFCESCGAKVEK